MPVAELTPAESVPDDEALAFEAAAVKEVTGSLGDAIARLIAQALAWRAAGITGQGLTQLLLAALSRLGWTPMNPRLEQAAVDAVELGVQRALRDLSGRDRTRGGRGTVPDLETPDLDGRTRVVLREARDLARTLPMDTQQDLMAVLGRASTARSRAEGQARWTATEGINAGTVEVARRTGHGVIWVAERDACLHCLAYAGWSVAAGALFPGGLTFGDHPLGTEGVPYPPLHPNCRCQVRIWGGPLGAPPEDYSSTSPAARLAAEARRSVVYGWTEHASHAATVRAMDRLLRAGADLPPSVERRARTLARQGRTLAPPR